MIDGSKLSLKLKDKSGKSIISNGNECSCIVQSEEVNKNTEQVLIQFSANELPKLGWYVIFCNNQGKPYRENEYSILW